MVNTLNFKEEKFMDTRFAISEYPDAAILTAQLDELITVALCLYHNDWERIVESKVMLNAARNNVLCFFYLLF